MTTDSLQQFAPPLPGIVERLRERGHFVLRPEKIWNASLSEAIAALTATRIGAVEGDPFEAAKSGLLLWNDDLDRSHTLSQKVRTPTGSYWHGIMHRREGDDGNAKYWFRRVGEHPLFVPLGEAAQEVLDRHQHDPAAASLGTESWDPFAFVDAGRRHPDSPLLHALQTLEIDHLVQWCLHEARGE